VNQAVAGDEAVAIDDVLFHAELLAAMPDQFVGFDEGTLVQQQVNAFAGGELALSVLPLAAFVAASGFGAGVTPAQLLEAV
jgi:hypothetical protein